MAGAVPRELVVAAKVVQDLVSDGVDLVAVQSGLDGPVLELSPALSAVVHGRYVGLGGELHQQALHCAVGGQGLALTGHDEEIELIHFLYLL